MSDENDVQAEDITETVAPIVQDELEALKKRADMMGLKYHHRVGVDKLKAQVDAAINGQSLDDDTREQKIKEMQDTMKEAEANRGEPAPETPAQRSKRLRMEAGELVRIRVSCMNPNKKDYDGEIYTVSNAIVGTFKKYVPFNAENGWHVPRIILNHLKEKQCQIFYTATLPNGQKVRKGKLIKELNIEIMDPLTLNEMKDLQIQQAMAAGNG